MSIQLKDSGAILLGSGGNPTEDSGCCCVQVLCEECLLQIQDFDQTQFSCVSCEASTLPGWAGDFCEGDAGFCGAPEPSYVSNQYLPFPVPVRSINGMTLSYASICSDGLGGWTLFIMCFDGAVDQVLWSGLLAASATADGIYIRTGGCSLGPASLTVVACT